MRQPLFYAGLLSFVHNMTTKAPLLLLLETATPVCSVALYRGEQQIAVKESTVEQSHSSLITPFIQDMFEQEGLPLSAIDAIGLSAGPGSYTGLRIGASVAKGFCYALNKPLIAINTLEAMAYGAAAQHEADFYIPMIDARRMEVYTAVYNRNMQPLLYPQPLELSDKTYHEFTRQGQCVVFGTGAAKFIDTFSPSNLVGLEGFTNSAKHLFKPALLKHQNGDFTDTAYFEPSYLKNFLYTTR